MPYIIEIPDKIKPEIIRVFDSQRAKMSISEKALIFLMTVYCRYVEKLGHWENVEEKTLFYIRCGDCRNRMMNWFEANIDKWENNGWDWLQEINDENESNTTAG